MSDEPHWPLPHYDPGPPDHLHAIGVIALTFGAFQANVESLYFHFARKRLSQEMAEYFWDNLNEDKRITAARKLFEEHDDKEVRDYGDNLLDYFNWCRNCRNQLLHSERYPAGLFRIPDTLHLIKAGGKKSKNRYMKLKLSTLRMIAEKTREGVIQCASFHLNLRFRGVPEAQVPETYKPYRTLPELLKIPKYLELTERP
jgi:hypothetical protein